MFVSSTFLLITSILVEENICRNHFSCRDLIKKHQPSNLIDYCQRVKKRNPNLCFLIVKCYSIIWRIIIWRMKNEYRIDKSMSILISYHLEIYDLKMKENYFSLYTGEQHFHVSMLEKVKSQRFIVF